MEKKVFVRSSLAVAFAAMLGCGVALPPEAEAFSAGFKRLQAANAAFDRKSTSANPHLRLVADDDDKAKSELAKQYLSLIYSGEINDIVDLMSRDTLVYVTKNRGFFDAAVAAMREEAEQHGGAEEVQIDDISLLWVDVTIKFADGTEKSTTVFFDEEDGSYRLDLVPASGEAEVPK